MLYGTTNTEIFRWGLLKKYDDMYGWCVVNGNNNSKKSIVF